ncbi:MAG TPA: hypothetical protein VGP78_05825 [Solirubrobacteraceae bacterium]|nr:hypothetical protein [Solirubrobacteraceae bacterium]
MRARWMLSAAACAAGLLAAAPAAQAGVQVGSSGWQWGTPLPQGNTIRAMSFAGGRGYAAGDFGTLLRTDDGGATWSGLLAGTHTGLTEVQAIDGDSLFAGGGCVARRSDDGGQTFVRVAFTPVESSCREQLAAGWFVDERTGYLVLTDGTVLRTDDDGQTFSQRTALPGTRAQGGQARPADIVFLTPDTGIAATSDGRLHRTTDGGTSWALVSATDRAVREIAFVDATTGYAAGDGSLLLRTTDGGATWSPRGLSGSTATLSSVRCASAQLCVFTTERGDQLVRTADAGETASLVTPSPDPVHAAAFASPGRIVAAGDLGSTAVSDDAGVNFSPVGGRLGGSFNRIVAGLAPGTAYAPGDNGTLATTTDGGRTWRRGNVSTSEDVVDVAFPTTSAGFALDTAGGLFRTADAGATWRPLDTGTTARPAAVDAPSQRTVLLAGPLGIRRSTDAGDTFDAVHGRLVATARLRSLDPAGRAVVAFGPAAILRSLDGGRTWTRIPRPGAGPRTRGKLVADADFLSAATGYVVTTDGTLYRTRDAGRHYAALPGVGTERVLGIAFSSAERGYLVVDRFGDVTQPSGFLLRTTDAGATWHPQFVVSTPISGFGLAAAPGGTDYLLGGDSSLLATTTGGDAGRASTLTADTRRRALGRPASITVRGRLSPAAGNERVTVSRRAPGSARWEHQTVKVAANGSYTTSWRVGRGTTSFVAQWAGDFRSTGDGSPVLTVRVGR